MGQWGSGSARFRARFRFRARSAAAVAGLNREGAKSAKKTITQ